jgi:hypothetical protein
MQDKSIIAIVRFLIGLNLFAERRAHAPLVAAAEVTHGFGVVVTESHLNRTATSGCVARLVSLLD